MSGAPPVSGNESALVLLSGGQDSTVCLAWALERYSRVETLGFDYGQRHLVELECRKRVLAEMRQLSPDWDRALGEDHVLDLGVLGQVSETALTRETEIELSSSGLPSTFVPARNLVFLTLASALAYRRGIDSLVGGMCETDYSGYPDCRHETLSALERAISLGLDRELAVRTPLMYIDKAETWAMALEMGGEGFVNLILEDTHTCYVGDRSTRNDWGYGCGSCPACLLRASGWRRFRGLLDAQ